MLKISMDSRMIEKNTKTTAKTIKENKGTTIFSFIISFKDGTDFLPISLLYLYVHHRKGTILYRYPIMLRTIQSNKYK